MRIYDATFLLYVCSLSDTTVVESVKTLGLPLIGDARQLDIIMLHHSTDQQYLIRIKQNREKTFFEVLEVLVRPDKPYVFDCLNLERYTSLIIIIIIIIIITYLVFSSLCVYLFVCSGQ